MTELFLRIVNMSITASILAVVVLLLRLLLKKAPRWISVLLWGLVAIRLICPFAVESPVSLMPKTDWVAEGTDRTPSLAVDSIPEAIIRGDSVSVSYIPVDPAVEIQKRVSVYFVLSCIWLGGIAVLLLHTQISTVRLRRSVSAAIRVRDHIWESSAVDSPFVLGLIRPRIYVPRGMEAEKLAFVIAHEEAHIRRRDHWWKPLGFLLLCIHWFNPVMWLAYILLCRDIEMACDERVVKEYDEVQRADYSEALLGCSVKRSMISACPLAFGEVGVKQRIKSVLNYRKPAFWIVVVAVIACIAAAVCFLTNPQETLDIDSVSRVAVNDLAVSDEFAQNLVSLINGSGKTYFPVGADDPNDLSAAVQIDCSDGSMYILHYQYYSGFSFHPSHPGEDDYRSILTYFSPDGKGSKAWRLEYDFDAVFKKWYDEVNIELALKEGFALQGRYALLSDNRSIMILTNESRQYYDTEYLVLNPESPWNDPVDLSGFQTGDFVEARGLTIAELDPPIFDLSSIRLIEHGSADSINNELAEALHIAGDMPANNLTLDDVLTLSAKGHSLTWEDFAGYSHSDVGSGLFIWQLPIDETFSVRVGGGSMRTEPMYVYLCAKSGEEEERIDIRDGGVEEFLRKYRSSALFDTVLLNDHPVSYFVDLAWDDAQSLAESAGVTIDKNRFNMRHNFDGSTVWIQFYGITETGWDDRFVDTELVRTDTGDYAVPENAAVIKSNSEQIKKTSLVVIGNCFENIEDRIRTNPSLRNKESILDMNAYDQMLNYSETLVLAYIFSEFLAGGQTDLHGFVLQQIMTELLKENEIIAYDAENGQDYFDHWLDSARSAEKQHDAAWMEENVPAIALVLSMTDR